MSGNRNKRASTSTAEQGSSRRRRSESPFDSLDDPLLNRIFSFLGFDGAYVKSGALLVCRRWRDMLATFEWGEISLEGLSRRPREMSRALRLLIAKDLIDISRVKSFSISLEKNAIMAIEQGSDNQDDDFGCAVQQMDRTLLALKICNFLLKFVERAAKKGWPLERFKLVTDWQTWPGDAALSKLGIQTHEDTRGEGVDDGSYVEQVLEALAAGGLSQLKHLEIDSSTAVPNLRGALAPFPMLQSLRLGCSELLEDVPAAPPAAFYLEEQDAAGIVKLLPQLRSLAAGFGKDNKAVKRLAGLEHLEELEILDFRADQETATNGLLADCLVALAMGPVGLSLKRLAIYKQQVLTETGACTVHAIARFRNLEELTCALDLKDVERDYGAAEAGMRALGAMPELRVLDISLRDLQAYPGLFTALAESVRRAPKLKELSFSHSIQKQRDYDSAAFTSAISSVLSAAAKRPGILRSWKLDHEGEPGLSVADATLLASCAPSLSRLNISHFVSSSADLEPVRILHTRYASAGLRLDASSRIRILICGTVSVAVLGVHPALVQLFQRPSKLRVTAVVGRDFIDSFNGGAKKLSTV